ncbi:putative Cytochrome P450 [Seiridium unicorne]|uniref:Cytochrome P450 n=1 Tax=Seiridium unicorne TaxID=138068 RepID=A0ABR2V944_9PEZI
MHIIQQRLIECISSGGSDWNEKEEVKRLTIMHNMTELTKSSDYWNPELLAQSLLGIWFAAAHQPWMNLHFVILELCLRTEWQTSLRQELEQHLPLDYKSLEQLPLLDSFIKETVRLNPLDTRMYTRDSKKSLEGHMLTASAVAIRRKAMEPYTFSDGSLSIPTGATVCVSAYNLMHNRQTYEDPDSFKATRFIPPSPTVQQRKFTEVSETFPVWGYGSLACPGRFHASLVIKMVVSQLILTHDLTLEDEQARTRWSWETFTMPYESTRVTFKKRQAS